MARANFVKKAQKNIYENGKYVQYKSEKGKRAGQMVSKLDRTVPKNDSDKIIIAVGESYYWWQFKNGGKNFSKSRPKNSQLTQSGFKSQLFDIQDELSDCRGNVTDASDLESFRDDIVSRLEELKDECQSSLDAMPEHLQETSSSGELLNERIQALESAIDELTSVDCDYDEPDEEDLREELKDDITDEELNAPDEDDERFDDWDEDEERKKLVTEAMIEEKKAELLSDWLDEKCEEISNVSIDC